MINIIIALVATIVGCIIIRHQDNVAAVAGSPYRGIAHYVGVILTHGVPMLAILVFEGKMWAIIAGAALLLIGAIYSVYQSGIISAPKDIWTYIVDILLLGAVGWRLAIAFGHQWVVIPATAIALVALAIVAIHEIDVKPFRVVATILTLAIVVATVFLTNKAIGAEKAQAADGSKVTTTPNASNNADTATATPTPAEAENQKKVDELLKLVNTFDDETMLKNFGAPRQFDPRSTLGYLNKRAAATGILDAVTYDFNHGKNWIAENLLANPIYLQGVDLMLRKLGIVTDETSWATIEMDFNKTIEKDKNGGTWCIKLEQHLLAARYAMLLTAAKPLDEPAEDFKLVEHYPLDPDREVIITSTEPEKEEYKFWYFQFETKDNKKLYFGINQLDGRFAVFERVKEAPKPSTPKPTSKPSPTPTPKPTPEPDKDKDVDTDKKDKDVDTDKKDKDVDTDKEDKDVETDKDALEKDPNKIPDNQGNAPIGGTGTDGVDDLGPGPYQPFEPVHVDQTPSHEDDTRVFIQIPTGSNKDDENTHWDMTLEPDDNTPVEERHDTTFTYDVPTENGGTVSITVPVDDEPVNDGSGFYGGW